MTRPPGVDTAVVAELLEECRQWYAEHLGLRSDPVRTEDIVFLTDSQGSKALGWYTNGIDLRRLAVSLLAIGVGSVAAMFVAGESIGNAMRLASGVMLAGAAYLPCVLRRVRVFVNVPRHRSGADLTRTVIHELAHAYHNRWLRGWFHSALDLVLWPFGLSCQEGIATWVEAEYCRSKGLPFRASALHPKYRRSYEAVAVVEHAFGRRAVIGLLKYA